jgi:hypothetical protein
VCVWGVWTARNRLYSSGNVTGRTRHPGNRLEGAAGPGLQIAKEVLAAGKRAALIQAHAQRKRPAQ